MKNTHLVPRKYGSKRYFHFRGCVPQDLISLLGGKKRFQISLKNVNYKDSLLVSVSLQTLTEQLFSDIRKGMKTLSLEDIKEILKVEVRKSILQPKTQDFLLVVLNNLILDVLGIPIHLTLLFSYYLSFCKRG